MNTTHNKYSQITLDFYKLDPGKRLFCVCVWGGVCKQTHTNGKNDWKEIYTDLS